MTPELHRPVAVAAILPGGQEFVVEANQAECAALAARMRLPAVQSLHCRFRLSPGLGGAVAAAGWLEAEVVQTCVVTLEDFAATISEQFEVCFVPAGSESDEIDPDETVDEIPYAEGVIDLGEAAAEQLALTLDPYPHAPEAFLPEIGSADEGSATAFARLAEWRRRH